MKFIERSLAMIFALFAFNSLYPSYLWENAYIYKINFIVLFLLSVIYFFSNKSVGRNNIIAFVVLSLWIVYGYFPRGDDIALISSGIIGILIFSLLPSHVRLSSFNIFLLLVVVILLLSIIQYPFIVFGFVDAIGHIEPTNYIKASRGQFYINYGLNAVLNDQHLSVFGYQLFRFSSIFDEPGMVGTITAILTTFILNKKSQNNNFKISVLVVSNILSFSLGGYILLLVGVCSRYLLSLKSISFKLIINTSLIFVLLLTVLATDGGKRYILDRVWDGEKITIKDNRVDDKFEKQYLVALNDIKTVLIGEGKDAHVRTGYDVSSYKGVIFNYGLLGFIFSIILVFYMSLFVECKRFYLSEVSFVLVILLNMFQRPYDYNFYYYYIMLAYGSYIRKELVI
ncbi:hypothetical protein ACOW9W_000294 [Vibrio parahaemolyticus]